MLKRLSSFYILLTVFYTHSFSQSYELDSLRTNMSEVQQFLFIRQHDTTYISNYNDKLALRLIANTKLNYFQLYDKSVGESVTYTPNRGLNLGLGVSYRWFSLDLVFSSSIEENTEIKDNRYLDFQGRVYSNKHFLETKLQYYDGYKMAQRSSDFFDDPTTDIIRDDIRTVNLGLQYLFAFNYEKFSFKAPFVLSEVQRKSVGSVIGGVAFNFFVSNGDSSLIPSAGSKMNPSLGYSDMAILDLSFRLGYMYSFVVKENYFLSLGLIPGIGLSSGDYKLDTRVDVPLQFSWSAKALATLGYNAERVFTGVQFFLDVNSVKHDTRAYTNIGTGKAAIFVGYRFDVKNKTRNLFD